MFHREHVRVGNHVHIGYFFAWCKRPLWIGRKVKWLL
jgi:hypothetical protein